MKFFKNPLIIIGIISIILFGIIYIDSDYLTYKEHKCRVLEKIDPKIELTGKFQNTPHFYLHLKDESEIDFNLLVSPSLYTQSKPGDILYLELRRMDIKQTAWDNLIYFFGQIILVIIGIFCLSCGIVFQYLDKKDIVE